MIQKISRRLGRISLGVGADKPEQHRTSRGPRAILAALALLSFSQIISAQEITGAMTGTVKDASIGLSGGSYAVPPVKGTTSFSRINGQASALLQMVESTSDQAPVPSLYRTYSDLCRDFNATSAAWQSLQGMVSRLNADSKHADHRQDITFTPVSPLTCAPALRALAP